MSRLYHLPNKVASCFDLRGFHPPLGPTPDAEFHGHYGIVVERYSNLLTKSVKCYRLKSSLLIAQSFRLSRLSLVLKALRVSQQLKKLFNIHYCIRSHFSRMSSTVGRLFPFNFLNSAVQTIGQSYIVAILVSWSAMWSYFSLPDLFLMRSSPMVIS